MTCSGVYIYYLNIIEYPLSKDALEEKFPYIKSVFEGFKLNQRNENIYHLVFILRRIVLSVLIVFTNEILQLSAGISLCLAVSLTQDIFYIFYIKPFENNFENIKFIINELILLCFYFGVIIPELGAFKIKSENLAIIEIRIVLTALGFNVLVNLLEIVKNVYLKIKKRFFTNSSRISPIITSVVDIKADKIK